MRASFGLRQRTAPGSAADIRRERQAAYSEDGLSLRRMSGVASFYQSVQWIIGLASYLTNRRRISCKL